MRGFDCASARPRRVSVFESFVNKYEYVHFSVCFCAYGRMSASCSRKSCVCVVVGVGEGYLRVRLSACVRMRRGEKCMCGRRIERASEIEIQDVALLVEIFLKTHHPHRPAVLSRLSLCFLVFCVLFFLRRGGGVSEKSIRPK